MENFNWAWQFRLDDSENWQQFDCTDCLQLEFNFQAHKLSETADFRKVQIIIGVVDLDTDSLYDDSGNFKGKVQRTKTNSRKRPNASRRHDPVQFDARLFSEAHFISDTNLEWTSLNYRKEKAAALSPSRRRMVLIIYQKQQSYFPTMREIME